MMTTVRRRFHLFEFGDQPWLRGWMREAYLDCLNLALRSGGQFRGVHKAFANWASRIPGAEVLDLGSGGGGPVETMLRAARADGTRLPRVYLSDLYPSPDHYRALSDEFGKDQLDYLDEPESALDVKRRDIRLRSIFSALHHFSPDQASAIVTDATSNADGLFVLEPFHRNLRHLLLVLLSGPFPYMLAPFFSTSWSWRKLLFCTVLPVVPLLVMFDGCVSVLRTYAAEEIVSMIPESARNLFDVQIGTLPYLKFFGSSYIAIARRKS